MKVKNWKKFLSAFLALTMIFSLCGTTAFAASDVTPPNEAAQPATAPESPVPETEQSGNSEAGNGEQATEPVEPSPIPTPTPETTPTIPHNPSIVIPGDNTAPEPPIDSDVEVNPVAPIENQPPYRISTLMATPYANPAGIEVMRFTWNGTEVVVTTGSNGNFAGGTWTCDLDGNFHITFTSNGTFVLTGGSVDTATAKLIGGGAGGENGWIDGRTCHGGNGGGAGESKTSPITINLNQSYTVTVGRGGVTATAGTASQFGDVIAAGGARSGGGAGGNHAELRKGGSGGGAGEQKSGAIKLTAGTSITITIGVGGTGGTGGTVSSSISYL